MQSVFHRNLFLWVGVLIRVEGALSSAGWKTILFVIGGIEFRGEKETALTLRVSAVFRSGIDNQISSCGVRARQSGRANPGRPIRGATASPVPAPAPP